MHGARRLPGAQPVLLLASVGRDSLPMSFPLDATPLPEARTGPLTLDDAPDPSSCRACREKRSGGSPVRIALPNRCGRCWPRWPPTSGRCRVNSTCRSKTHNARVGGAKRSYHLTGNAVDFRISGAVQPVLDFLTGKRMVGGLKHYGFGVFHIDTGPRRTWANNSWAGAKVGKAKYAKAKYKRKRAAKRRRYDA